MKYIKMLGLLAVAAAALMAFAGSASAATEITSSTGSTPTIHAVAVTEPEPPTLHGAATVTCTSSTVTGTVEEHVEGTPKGAISALTFTGCAPNHVTVLENGTGKFKTGTLEVHTKDATANGNGTLTSSGTRVTIQLTNLGVSCIFETLNTDIGTVTGGEHAVLDIESSNIPRVAGDSGIFCGGNGVWTGKYLVTHPTDLTIH